MDTAHRPMRQEAKRLVRLRRLLPLLLGLALLGVLLWMVFTTRTLDVPAPTAPPPHPTTPKLPLPVQPPPAEPAPALTPAPAPTADTQPATVAPTKPSAPRREAPPPRQTGPKPAVKTPPRPTASRHAPTSGAEPASRQPDTAPSVAAAPTPRPPPPPSEPPAQLETVAMTVTPSVPTASDDTSTPKLAIPRPLKLRYRIHGKISFIPYRAHGELLWTHDGQTYRSRLELGMILLGSRVISSRGQISASGLRPKRFVDKIREERSAEFDYDRSEIRFSEREQPEPLPVGAQDQLSIFIQLGSLIGAQPDRYPAGSQITVPTVGVYGPDDWQFVVNATEHLKLPGGEVDALKLTHAPRHKDEPKVELWLAASQGWLPLRMRLSQPNGDYIDQLWQDSSSP